MPLADTRRLNITSAYYPHQFNCRYTPLQTLTIAGTPRYGGTTDDRSGFTPESTGMVRG
jgi:hypothetical protein